jgi:translation elongation factor EF-4
MKTAKLNMVLEQVKNTLDFSAEECLPVSAKLGTNCEKILHEVIERIPK